MVHSMTEHANSRPPRRRQPDPLDPVKLRRRRLEQGLTLTAAAKAAAITKGHLSQIEHGRRGGSVPVIHRIARALGCTVTDLMPDRPRVSA